jgi:hypothetical protein
MFKKFFKKMEQRRLLRKWDALLNYSSQNVDPLNEREKLECAILLESAERVKVSSKELALIRQCHKQITVYGE